MDFGIGGSYVPDKEVRIAHEGREVLYITGHTNIETACCGVSNWGYALVPGYIVKWRSEKNASGNPVSEVEPVPPEEQNSLRQLIESREIVAQVQFW